MASKCKLNAIAVIEYAAYAATRQYALQPDGLELEAIALPIWSDKCESREPVCTSLSLAKPDAHHANAVANASPTAPEPTHLTSATTTAIAVTTVAIIVDPVICFHFHHFSI